MCVWDYGLPNNIDYEKFALYVFLVFVANEEGIDYNSMPLEEMADTLAVRYPDLAISRQTLKKYQEYVCQMEVAIYDIDNPKYVLADTSSGSKEYKSIDGATYREAWQYYYSQKEHYFSDPETADWASASAYRDMVKKYGGHPKKHIPMVGNACSMDFIDLATEKVVKSKVVAETS